ncbi:MAG TPA: twin-arginine translocase subunit TatC [Roseiflexaceae bacterium]|nr:twin-arginine translocase subunit TatC [Roseiflexaceae bacterium]
MNNSQFLIGVGVVLALLILPLVSLVLVRVLIPLKEEPDDLAVESEPPMEFTTLRDFWEGTIPHLRELRDRLIKCAIAIGLGAGVGIWLVNDSSLLGERLPVIISKHFIGDRDLIATQVAETFVTYMRIAIIVGIILAMPVIVYQVIAFFVPAMRPVEKRIVFSALPFVTELFLAGLAFGWMFTVPTAVQWLLDYGTGENIQSLPRVEDFYSIVATLMLWNGVIFELPAIIYLLARLGLVSAQTLGRTRRYAFVVIVIVAALITPTGDPFNLMLLAVPMYLLYELGILLARFVPRRTSDGLPEGVSHVGG